MMRQIAIYAGTIALLLATSSPGFSRGQAKKVGRAVGKILGRVIGTASYRGASPLSAGCRCGHCRPRACVAAY